MRGLKKLVIGGGCFIVSTYISWDIFRENRFSSFLNETLCFSSWDSNWDKRQDKYISNIDKVKAKKHYILIRHGQYNLNGETDNDHTLTELGKKQAETLGRRLKDMGIVFDKIYHSNLTRAIETTNIITNELNPDQFKHKIQVDSLAEGYPCIPSPKNSLALKDIQVHEDNPRIESAFRKIFRRANHKQNNDSYDLIVCHANVIRYILLRALQLPPEAWLRFSLAHCSMTVISVYPNGDVSVRAVGDCGHLEYNNQTRS